MNDDILLTREQIGTALEYKNPIKAIQKIHLKHSDRLESLCMRAKIEGSTQIGGDLTKSDEQERVYYTERGIMELCRWSRQPKANLFMDWVWDIVEKYRNKEIVDIVLLSSTLNKMVSILEKQEERITKAESQLQESKQIEEKSTYKKPYNPWFAKMQPKYQLLEDYFNITRGQLYKNILKEMENIYNIDTNQIQADYLYENNITSCYPLDPYEFKQKYRDMVEGIVNDNFGGDLTKSDEQERVYYTERGIMELCRWSRQPKANLFMDWVWDIVEKYRNKEIVDIVLLSSTLNKMVSILEKQEERITKAESQLQESKQIEEKSTYKKPYNPWFAKMQPKYQLLEDYFNITRGQLYKNILKEMENIYNIDTNQIQADYLYENNITSCYPLDPYEFKQKYRDMVEGIVNDNLVKYKIVSKDNPIAFTRHITIFDTSVPEENE